MTKKIALVIEGGVGDHILSTVALRQLREKNKDADIGVIATHPRTLLYNPNITKLYDAGEPMDFYERYIKLNDPKNCFRPNVYERFRMNQETPIIDSLCSIFKVENDNKPPEVFITDQEEGSVKHFLSQFRSPVIPIHLTGSSLKFNNTKRTQNKDYPLELMEQVIKKLMYKYQFVQIGINDEPRFNWVPSFWNTTTGEAFALAKLCHSFISIDSFFPHAAAVFNNPGVVLFGSTSKKAYGHKIHCNLDGYEGCTDKDQYKKPFLGCGRPDGVFFDIEPCNYLNTNDTPTGRVGHLWQCKYVSCMKSISPDLIVENLEKICKAKE